MRIALDAMFYGLGGVELGNLVLPVDGSKKIL